MNDGQVHQISADLGGLKKAVEMMTDLWKSQEASATEGRRTLHQKFEIFKDEINLQIAGLSLRMDRLTDQVKLVEPSVIAFKEEKLRKEGAQRLGKTLIAAMTLAAGGVGWGLHEFIGWIRHP